MNGLADIAASMPTGPRTSRSTSRPGFGRVLFSAAKRWGVAVASAIASRNQGFRDPLLADACREVDAAVIEDAEAAAALMSMTNIYYRFRHLIGKVGHSEKPARLRMNLRRQAHHEQDRSRSLLRRGQCDPRMRGLPAGTWEGGTRRRTQRGSSP